MWSSTARTRTIWAIIGPACRPPTSTMFAAHSPTAASRNRKFASWPQHWDLPVADKPATPCLSSRVAYGLNVTPERLARIDRAEQFLRSLGFHELRVRYHADDMARIEVPVSEVGELCDPEVRASVVAEFEQLGFKFITLDLAGFRSGSFTKLVPSEMLTRFS